MTNAKSLEKILFRLGFELIRQKGSHRFYRHPDGRYTTIAHYGNADIKRPLLHDNLKEIDMSPEAFIAFLKD